jgi:hypothetical protein
VDVTIDIVLGDSLDNSLGTLNVDVLQGKVPSPPLAQSMLVDA